MASLSWTDSVGSASLDNSEPEPSSRFASWTVLADDMADSAEGLGDGVVYAFTFGARYGATFTLPYIPNASQALLARFERHAKNGGVFTVTTDDAASRVYATCQVPKGATIDKQYDPVLRVWALTLTVRNVAPAPTEMLCLYP